MKTIKKTLTQILFVIALSIFIPSIGATEDKGDQLSGLSFEIMIGQISGSENGASEEINRHFDNNNSQI